MQCKGAWRSWDWKAICLKNFPLYCYKTEILVGQWGNFILYPLIHVHSMRRVLRIGSQQIFLHRPPPLERFSYDLEKWFRYMFVICFISQEWMKRWKHGPSVFPPKKTSVWRRHCSIGTIVLQFDVKAKYRLISTKFFGHEVFSPERSLNQSKATHVSVRSINQSNRSISVRLLFLFCSRVFISRSYENRSIRKETKIL